MVGASNLGKCQSTLPTTSLTPLQQPLCCWSRKLAYDRRFGHLAGTTGNRGIPRALPLSSAHRVGAGYVSPSSTADKPSQMPGPD